MTPLSLAMAVALYGAFAVFVIGTGLRLGQWLATPVPWRIPTTPAPTTRAGVGLRLARETVLFESLWKASPATWVLAWPFHVGLAVVLLGHLRFFTEGWWLWVLHLAAWGWLASAATLAGLLGLWGRRLAVDRVRYISAPSDHLMLALLVALVASGMALKYLDPVDLLATKGFVRGLLTLDLAPLPAHGLLVLHLGLVAALLAVFPFSKLLHAPGLYLSPTRNQVDDARERGV
jgi:nitrate reductase gamma subunit